eukprot:SAG22_NODE_1103_length_5558_cov_1.611650_4_plen_425_part_01
MDPARSRRASVQAILLSKEGSSSPAEAAAELQPTWWLFLLSLYCVPLALTNNLFTGIILPPLLQEIVNTTATYDPTSTATKQSAMGQVSTLISFINLSVPLLGWLADRCAFRFCRSAFIVTGQLMAIGGLLLAALTSHGCYSVDADTRRAFCSWPVFLPGFVMFHAGYLVGWVPYMAVMPNINPAQRSKLAGFTSFVEAGAGWTSNGLGVLVGERVLSTTGAFYTMVLLNVIAIPLGTLSMQPRPGCCAADNNNNAGKRAAAAAARQDSAEAASAGRLSAGGAAAAAGAVDGGGGGGGVAGRVRGWCRRARLAQREFLAAFRTCRAFRLQFLMGFIGSLNPFGIFMYYWYQDVFAPNFSVFGFRLTSSTQAAVSLLGAASSVITMALAVPGGYIGDMYERKPLLFFFAVVAAPLPLIYLLPRLTF